ncbi:hypothetical protein [Aquimarina algiphila]|uniref:hypothetical protein n=1 Tax=Aquimarina algiphila TaxID=2047982 RepID=UPI00232F33C0|nr:hypothetical protein [Aquimarina algiphila]
MRRFIANEIEFKLTPLATSETYIQKIRSEVFFKGKTSVSQSQKTLNIDIILNDYQSPQVKIKTIDHKVTLDNLLRTQEEITLKMASLTNIVLLGLNNKGHINTINNHTIIQQKWTILKQELEQLYKGNTAEIYFYGIDKKIKDAEKLLVDFQQNRLFGLLWNGLHGFYSDDDSKSKKRIKIISNAVEHIPISVEETITCKQIDRNEITLQVTGQLNGNETFIKKIESYFIRNGGNKKFKFELTVYNGVFKFNLESGLLKEVTLVIETKFGDSYTRKDQFNIHNI